MKHALLGIGIALLLTGCAAGVEVRPVGRNTQALARADAVAIGHQWCAQNGWHCQLDDVDLVDGQTVWLLEFDAVRPGHDDHGHGKGHGNGRGLGHVKAKGKGHWKKAHAREERTELTFAIDAWTGELLDVRRG